MSCSDYILLFRRLKAPTVGENQGNFSMHFSGRLTASSKITRSCFNKNEPGKTLLCVNHAASL